MSRIARYVALGLLGGGGSSAPAPSPYRTALLANYSTNLLGYWTLDETSGTQATDYSANARHGSYSGVTLNGATFPDGTPAPSFDGNDFVNVFTAGLASAFNPNLISYQFWIKTNTSGAWADNVTRIMMTLFAAAGNDYTPYKFGAANQVRWENRAGGTNKDITATITPSANWHSIGFTLNKAGDQAIAYFDGVATAAATTGLGTWAGSLTMAVFGASNLSGATGWVGAGGHLAIWDRVLTPTDMANLAVMPP